MQSMTPSTSRMSAREGAAPSPVHTVAPRTTSSFVRGPGGEAHMTNATHVPRAKNQSGRDRPGRIESTSISITPATN